MSEENGFFEIKGLSGLILCIIHRRRLTLWLLVRPLVSSLLVVFWGLELDNLKNPLLSECQ